MSFQRRIGIIAGAGLLPALVAEANHDCYIIRLEPFCNDPRLLKHPGMAARMDQFGHILKELRNQNIKDVVLVGGVRRPSLLSLRPDMGGWSLLFEILTSLLARGDDALLRGVRAAFERRGFVLHGVHELVQDLLAPTGVMGAVAPDDAAKRDIDRGLAAAREHGSRDRGQAIVVQHGRILDVEDRDGTDALIKRCSQFRIPGPGPVLVKIAKPGQDRALDLPTIGPSTIENAAAAGFAGIAVEAGSTLLADRSRLIALADQHGLFMIGIDG